MHMSSKALVLIFFLSGASLAAPDEPWLPLTESSLSVQANSALDFSHLVVPGPAGKNGWAVTTADGHITFERSGRPQRFLIASLTFLPLNGGFPDQLEARTLAQQLRRTGYNAVRLHYVDAMLMSGRFADFDFDANQLDRLHYLLAQLKEQGIYWIVDGLTSDNAAWGDVSPHRWTKKYRTKQELLADPKAMSHWKSLTTQLWGKKNPYTGVAPLQDPAMLGVILVNEGSLGFLATIDGNRYSARFAPLFRDWLKGRYQSDDELARRWGGALKAGESLTGVVEVPVSVRGSDARSIDFSKFVIDLENGAFRTMESHLRAAGFKGLVTAYNNWSFINSDITRSTLEWVDMHSYHVSPTQHGQPGSRIVQSSIHDNAARYVRELANTRQWGKPFTVSEYGQPFWNRWRHESVALMPAIAALQDWDGICQFAEVAFQNDYSASPHRRRQAIFPYGVGADPIARAAERLAAMLFLRGDVAKASGRIRLHVQSEQMLNRSGGWEQVPESWGLFGLVTGIGLDFNPPAEVPKDRELSANLGDGKSGWRAKVVNTLVRKGLAPGAERWVALRDAGVIGAANRTDVAKRFFESDSGQIIVNGPAREISVNTPNTVAMTTQGAEMKTGVLSVEGASVPATYAISSLDGKPLAESRRMLLWVLTDAANKGMSFEDAERTTLRNLGTFPPEIQPTRVRVNLATKQAANLKTWALSLSGERRELVATTFDAGALNIRIDLRLLKRGPAIFYEIAGE